ncbi:GNAT family N-acetyltransferase [Flavobacterium okayamense]|uniref:N-acetyltransferase domain-containing protein n=1 Tax=Flavobacterium okayamense TaxID=2830782 RepID=A0ABM7S5C3_9FLAO|nr:GNAT family N-acetyltransferase [Flavobacterium okayamense]BCY28674.1 hypothetical protein KK2020170_15420 [Flavobacterium okayamense]
MRVYKCLHTNRFQFGDFYIEPIRHEDRLEIMTIRNEQLYHLRQAKPLTIEDQDNYFNTVVDALFNQEKPSQLLFSFFEKDEFIGYGGLVHINWIDKNAEISFVMKTALEKKNFSKYWSNYLKLIEQLAFNDLNFHKIFTYAFDLRPHLYEVLESCQFNEEARLKEHCFFEGSFLDVVYHSKINTNISFRKPTANDLKLYFDWANDKNVRMNSYQSNEISLEQHSQWFLNKLNDDSCFMYLFENHIGNPIGQVRIQKQNEQEAIIGISNDEKHRGKGYATKMLIAATENFLNENSSCLVNAFIKVENTASEKAFQKAGFKLTEIVNYEGFSSFHYIISK